MSAVRWPVRLTLRTTPRPGWTFYTGGAGPDGMFLTQRDDEGRVWLTRLWSLGPFILSLDVHVPWSAAESMATAWGAREAARRERDRLEREAFERALAEIAD